MSFFALYYRTTDKAILDARQLDVLGNENVDKQGRAFADLFGAVPYFAPGLTPHFVGIGFNAEHPIRYPALWAPAIPGIPMRQPAQARKVPNKLKTLHTQLVNLWNSQMPHGVTQPRPSQLLRVLGTSEEAFVNGHQLHMFLEGEDTIYIVSTVPLNLPEILGSDVRAAQQRLEEAALTAKLIARQAVANGQKVIDAAPTVGAANDQ